MNYLKTLSRCGIIKQCTEQPFQGIYRMEKGEEI